MWKKKRYNIEGKEAFLPRTWEELKKERQNMEWKEAVFKNNNNNKFTFVDNTYLFNLLKKEKKHNA